MADNTSTVLQDVQNLESLSKSYETNAANCRAIGDYLKRQADNMFWKSKASESFKQNMGDYQRTLTNLETTMRNLSAEVKRRAEELRSTNNI